MTPSLPTFSIASASRSPITRSLFALIAPTWAISSLLETFFDMLVELLDRGVDGLLDAAPHGHRIAAGHDVARAFAENRPGQHGRGRRAVAGERRGLVGHLVHELGAHVLERVFQLDFLADGHAVLGDGRAAERLVDDHVAAGGPSVMATASASLSTPASILARAASSNINCFATVRFLFE